jgi:hypothetical protein
MVDWPRNDEQDYQRKCERAATIYIRDIINEMVVLRQEAMKQDLFYFRLLTIIIGVVIVITIASLTGLIAYLI